MFEKAKDVVIFIIIVAIAWAMWKPVLLDQRNLQALITTLRTQGQLLTQYERDLRLLRADVEVLKPQ